MKRIFLVTIVTLGMTVAVANAQQQGPSKDCHNASREAAAACKGTDAKACKDAVDRAAKECTKEKADKPDKSDKGDRGSKK